MANEIKSIQKRKQKLLRNLTFPVEGLPGSLSVSNLRCGKKSCHCQDRSGHEAWSLTFMQDGKKRVLHIPHQLVDDVRQRVEQGKSFKEAVNQILNANVELLVLLRKSKQRI